MQAEEQDNSRRQALAQYESICDMVDALEFAEEHSSDTIVANDDETDWVNLDEDERETFTRLLGDYSADDLTDPDSCRERIEQDALSVEVRSDWYTPGADEDDKAPAEYRILLCTGGPAVQIVGDLDQYKQPSSARLIHQDWFKPWTEVIEGVAQSTLLRYARCFYFGE